MTCTSNLDCPMAKVQLDQAETISYLNLHFFGELERRRQCLVHISWNFVAWIEHFSCNIVERLNENSLKNIWQNCLDQIWPFDKLTLLCLPQNWRSKHSWMYKVFFHDKVCEKKTMPLKFTFCSFYKTTTLLQTFLHNWFRGN